MNKLKTLIPLCSLVPLLSLAQPDGRIKPYDINNDRLIYMIGYSHLDTQWGWDYVRTIDECLKNVMTENFHLFETYPDYVFNFTGSRRYRMMKEYYPRMYEMVKEYVRKGRWHIAGSAVDEGEVIVSSPESIIRQTLYGTKYFMDEFGTTGEDAIFPDIFGFPACLPTVWKHSGLKGFSTAKVGSANCAVGVPFNVGVWVGPDGSRLVSALAPAHYVSDIPDRFDRDDSWSNRIDDNRNKYGFSFDYRYYGVGDMGGAPRKNDVKHAMNSLETRPDSKFRMILTSSDRIFEDITPEIEAKMPTYSGDMLLIEHSNGSSVSQGFMKRMNRKNENLAQAAELAATASQLLGQSAYPVHKLADAWELILGSQMHDILPGTSCPKAYEYSWNDEFIAANLFASTLCDAMGGISACMDTRAEGIPVVVYNQVATARQDIVSVTINFPKKPGNIRVIDPKGKEVPSQIVGVDGDCLKIIFLAHVPSSGFAVYDIRPEQGMQRKNSLKVTGNTLENEYYKVRLSDNGDIASIYDKKLRKELLKAPAGLEFLAEKPSEYPAWNMDWKDRQNPPVGRLDEDAVMRIAENGPVRVAIEITRKGRNSEIVQTISLAAGDPGKRVVMDNRIDWQSKGVSLKAAFPLTASDSVATYNQGVGTILRNNNNPKKFEVPHHKWFDLTDKSGKYGVSILENCKYTSDKPDDSTLRLTLMFTPEVDHPSDQGSQDIGIHYVTYGIYSHAGNWKGAETIWQAEFLDKPLVAFRVPAHRGYLGKEFSMLSVNNSSVGVMAHKISEYNDYQIIRVNELKGQNQSGVRLAFPARIVDAYEVNGREYKGNSVEYASNEVVFDLPASAIKSIAVKLAAEEVAVPSQAVVDLDYNEDVVSFDDNRTDGRIDKKQGNERQTYPAEEMPDGEFVLNGITFKMGSCDDEQNNVVACRGQEVQLPEGDYDKLYILAAAKERITAEFLAGDKKIDVQIGSWTGYVGQHYNRQFGPQMEVVAVSAPYVYNDEIAWFASHHHVGYPSKNETYKYCYIYKYELDIPAGAKSVRLPDNEGVKIFAATTVKESKDDTLPLQPLYDDVNANPAFVLRRP